MLLPASPPAPPPALLDRAMLTDVLADGGAEAGLAEMFITHSARRLDELDRAASAQDAKGIGHVAHTLQGTSATFGARRLAAALAAIARAPEVDRVRLAAAGREELHSLFGQTAVAVAAVARTEIRA